jgi:hypothetical protein
VSPILEFLVGWRQVIKYRKLIVECFGRPAAVIFPAKSCPDVVISAIAARDAERAKAYAKRWGIEKVFASYEG